MDVLLQNIAICRCVCFRMCTSEQILFCSEMCKVNLASKRIYSDFHCTRQHVSSSLLDTITHFTWIIHFPVGEQFTYLPRRMLRAFHRDWQESFHSTTDDSLCAVCEKMSYVKRIYFRTTRMFMVSMIKGKQYGGQTTKNNKNEHKNRRSMIRLTKQENTRFIPKDSTGTTRARNRLLKLKINTQRKEARDGSDKRIEKKLSKKAISKPRMKLLKF